jgi:DNA-binding transcriptional ArsR family regulator
MYLGSWKIDDNLTFCCNTFDPADGAAADADDAPSYRIYEDETATPIVTGSLAKLDDANTLGFYSEQVALSAANGFEKGKSYTVRIEATVNSVVGVAVHSLQIEAEVDAQTISASLNDPTAADIRAEIDSNSTQLAAIVADTNELQTDDVPGLIAALNDPTAADIRAEIDSNSTQLAAIVADTNELQTDDVPGLIGALNDPTAAAIADAVCDEAMAGHTTAGSLAKALADVLADTGSDGVAVATATAQAIADEILKRSAENVEDTASTDSLAELIMAGLNAAISGTTMTIRKPSDDSTFNTRTVTVDSDADPVVGIT